MKYKVTYYDIDADGMSVKDCYDIDYNTVDDTFSFTPVDNPVKIYKTVIIDHPRVSIYQNTLGMRITVKGYQYIRSGEYSKTITVITSVNENDL
jgi:hypothetical protein